MSRVKTDQKFVNTSRYSPSTTGPSKVIRIHSPNEDFHKAPTLTAWLFTKYDMSYKAFTRKSKARKEALRLEYIRDTVV